MASLQAAQAPPVCWRRFVTPDSTNAAPSAADYQSMARGLDTSDASKTAPSAAALKSMVREREHDRLLDSVVARFVCTKDRQQHLKTSTDNHLL